MIMVPDEKLAADMLFENGYVGRIPVRNIWLLMLYASNLFRQRGRGKFAIEDNPDNIPDLVAEILVHWVERRLMRNLSYGYQSKVDVLSRVRGRIDLLRTERHQLLDRGLVACRFDDLTANTIRNRFVRAALVTIAPLVRTKGLAHQCRALAGRFRQMGVTGEKPSRSEISTDRLGRHDADDQQMVAAAHLAFDLALPTENEGSKLFPLPDKEKHWIRQLFEKAVAGFYDVVLSQSGWQIHAGQRQYWQIESRTAGIDEILPSMQTDIVLIHNDDRRRIVIDTKFTSIVTQGQYRDVSLRSGYIYQMYAYLRSQVGQGDPLSDRASGLLLHPAINEMVDESVVIQGHEIRFATVDLGATANEIRSQLLQVIGEAGQPIDRIMTRRRY